MIDIKDVLQDIAGGRPKLARPELAICHAALRARCLP